MIAALIVIKNKTFYILQKLQLRQIQHFHYHITNLDVNNFVNLVM